MAAAEPKRFSNAVVNFGPKPGTRCKANQSRVSSEIDSDMSESLASRQGFLQDLPHIGFRNFVDKARRSQSMRQHEPHSSRQCFLIAAHRIYQGVNVPVLRAHRKAKPL